MNYLEKNKPTADTKLMWHMTWAYQADSTHASFASYGKDQMNMYNAIVGTVQQKVLTNRYIDGVIPVGTAIQNLRSSYVGDTVTRDGYHLNGSHGRYTAALTWYCVLTGRPASTVTATPKDYPAVADDIAAIREAVDNAVKTPYAVTASTHTAS